MPGDKIEVPIWLMPKRGELDKITKKGVKIPAYITDQFKGIRGMIGKMPGGIGAGMKQGFKMGQPGDIGVRGRAGGPSMDKLFQLLGGGKGATGTAGGSPSQNPMAKFLKLYKFDLFWKWLKGTWNTLNKLVPLVKSLSSAFSTAIGMILTAAILPFLGDILNVLKAVFSVASGILNFSSKFGPDIRDAVISALAILTANPEFLTKLITWFGKLSAVVGEYIPYVEKVSGVFKFLGAVVSTLHGWFNKIIGTIINLSTKLGGEGLGKVVSKVIGTFLRMANIALWISLIADILKLIVGAIFGKDNPLYKFLDIISEATDVVGWLIAGFKDILAVFGIGKGGNIGAILDSLGTKLGLADGGIVTSPTNALIGEAGPEAVIPLDQLGGMGGMNITVNGIVDERKFREIIQSVVNQSMRKSNSVRGSAF